MKIGELRDELTSPGQIFVPMKMRDRNWALLLLNKSDLIGLLANHSDSEESELRIQRDASFGRVLLDSNSTYKEKP